MFYEIGKDLSIILVENLRNYKKLTGEVLTLETETFLGTTFLNKYLLNAIKLYNRKRSEM